MNFKKAFLKILITVIIILVISILLFKFKILGAIRIGRIRHYINSYGNFSALVFVLIFMARTLLVFFPFSLMVMLGGSLFGEIRGFLLSMLAVFITANMAFFIGKFAGKDLINKIVHVKFKAFDSKVEQHGFKIIFFMRISSIFPYDIINYAAGMSKVKYRDFIIGTLLGIIPETFSLTYLGSNINHPFSKRFILGLILVIITMALPFMFSKSNEKQKLEE